LTLWPYLAGPILLTELHQLSHAELVIPEYNPRGRFLLIWKPSLQWPPLQVSRLGDRSDLHDSITVRQMEVRKSSNPLQIPNFIESVHFLHHQQRCVHLSSTNGHHGTCTCAHHVHGVTASLLQHTHMLDYLLHLRP
jgi:hypothetical protein